jgi:putative inorganic carbon (HCO3(-)) transporter
MYNYNNIKFLLNKAIFIKIYIFGFLLNIFFSFRHVFLNKNAYLTGGYSDFTSFSFYLSDLFIIFGFFAYFLPNISHIWHNLTPKPLRFLILWILPTTLLHLNSPNLSLNLWFLVKFLELIVAYGTFAYLFSPSSPPLPQAEEGRVRVGLFIKSFVILTSLESILGIWQFAIQKSVGLYKIGETLISPQISGIAKIVSGETTYIRAYGTFPHPNVFSAFLVISILFLAYLLVKSTNFKQKIAWSCLLFTNIIALTLTFSRAGYLGFVIGLIIFFSLLYWNNHKINFSNVISRTKIISVIVMVIVMVILSFSLLKPFILSRGTILDSSTKLRMEYNKAGGNLIKKYPIFGVGAGESVLHIEQALEKKLEPWQKQPPHNFFLVAGAELGIPALLIFIWIFVFYFWKLIKNYKLKIIYLEPTYYLLLTTILISFLVLMQFDHYFYTIWQTQVLLWVILGMITAKTNPSPFEERGGGEVVKKS